jgi:hypothetical protein
MERVVLRHFAAGMNAIGEAVFVEQSTVFGEFEFEAEITMRI